MSTTFLHAKTWCIAYLFEVFAGLHLRGFWFRKQSQRISSPRHDFTYIAANADRPWEHFTGRWQAWHAYADCCTCDYAAVVHCMSVSCCLPNACSRPRLLGHEADSRRGPCKVQQDQARCQREARSWPCRVMSFSGGRFEWSTWAPAAATSH